MGKGREGDSKMTCILSLLPIPNGLLGVGSVPRNHLTSPLVANEQLNTPFGTKWSLGKQLSLKMQRSISETMCLVPPCPWLLVSVLCYWLFLHPERNDSWRMACGIRQGPVSESSSVFHPPEVISQSLWVTAKACTLFFHCQGFLVTCGKYMFAIWYV